MSKTELKRVVDESAPEDLLFLEAYLAHRRRLLDSQHAEEMTRRLREMDEGRKFSLKQVRDLPESLANGCGGGRIGFRGGIFPG